MSASKPLTAAERQNQQVDALAALLDERDALAAQLAEATAVLDRIVPESAGWGLWVRIDGLAYQLTEARGIARRLADELRFQDAKGMLPCLTTKGRTALDAFDALHWPDPAEPTPADGGGA